MHPGCCLYAKVGSGKTIISLSYAAKVMKEQNIEKLFVITTAMKRNTMDFEKASYYVNLRNKIHVDSWNNIMKYKNVRGAFFIFDEQKTGNYKTWGRTFVDIAKKNTWIMCTATPGDKWVNIMPMFIANGYYKSKSEFYWKHVVLNPHVPYEDIQRYINMGEIMKHWNDMIVEVHVPPEMIAKRCVTYSNCQYDKKKYKAMVETLWDPYHNKPFISKAGLCYALRKCVNSDKSRADVVKYISKKVDKLIIFYNFDYELEILRNINFGDKVVAERNGHHHMDCPDADKWVYLVQYNSGCEAWDCLTTDTILFYSMNYSYSIMEQAMGRIDRGVFKSLKYYILMSDSEIDRAIYKSLHAKKKFNENKFMKKFFKEDKNGKTNSRDCVIPVAV